MSEWEEREGESRAEGSGRPFAVGQARLLILRPLACRCLWSEQATVACTPHRYLVATTEQGGSSRYLCPADESSQSRTTTIRCQQVRLCLCATTTATLQAHRLQLLCMAVLRW